MVVFAVVDNLVEVVVFAGVVVDMIYLYTLFLDNFVRVDCIAHSYHSYAVVCNHFWHSFAMVGNRHLYTSPIAEVEYLWDSYNSVANRPYLTGRDFTFGCWLLSRWSIGGVRWLVRAV